MGYTTEFKGSFRVDRPVDEATYELLRGLATTRRVARKNAGSEYGVQGEFYVRGCDDDWNDPTVEDYNRQPSTQPGLWCHWLIQDDRRTIEWDGGEKFYQYISWVRYLVDRVLAPQGYVLDGRVQWQGEDPKDRGVIEADGNAISYRTLPYDPLDVLD